MRRLIPSQIKEESTIIKGLTAKDLLILIIGVVLIAFVFNSSLPTNAKLGIGIAVFAIALVAVVPFEMVKGYKLMKYALSYLLRKKKFVDINIEETFGLKYGATIRSSFGHVCVIELHGIDFGIFGERTQDEYIEAFAQAVREVRNGKLVKLEKPLDLSKYIDYNQQLSLQNIQAIQSVEDQTAKIRNQILDNQNEALDRVNYFDRVDAEAFYFVVCDSNENACIETAQRVAGIVKQIGLAPRLLEERGLKLFVKLFFATTTENYNERVAFQGSEKDLVQFSTVREKTNKLVLDGQDMRVLCLGKYPYFVTNAWAWDLYSIEGCRVVFNFCTYTGKNINRVLSRSMVELRSRLKDEKLREDEKMKLATNYNSLETLMEELNYANETLYYTECYLMYPAHKHREILKQIRGKGIKVNDLVFTQYDGWLSMFPFLPMPGKDNRERYSPMQSASIAGSFPFVSKQLMDDEGSFLGYTSRFPAFFNQYELSDTRVNHNMIVLGKSGGGKSFFMKKTVLRAATEGKKIFILDPDNEYDHVCDVLHGNWIDVGGETAGRINPLQVFPSLREGGGDGVGDVSSHRMFLDQFFRTVCPMQEETRLYLNKVIAEMYARCEIFDETDLTIFQAENFPTFDYLLSLIKDHINQVGITHDAGEIAVYKKLSLYMEQFADGGIYARLWNGITTLKIENDFNVLNFQSLFANSNRIVANGQMLLLMRFLNQEVIKNRELNTNYNVDKKILIVIDEAHRFINPQFPVALEFMSTMGKQIRKYKGALMVATQNIDDFIGVSEDMKAQASAVINACQYSMIFGLFADDVNKVKELYANYNGGLTESEVSFITKAKRGEALFIVDINTRLPLHIDLFAGEQQWIEKPQAQEEPEETA